MNIIELDSCSEWKSLHYLKMQRIHTINISLLSNYADTVQTLKLCFKWELIYPILSSSWKDGYLKKYLVYRWELSVFWRTRKVSQCCLKVTKLYARNSWNSRLVSSSKADILMIVLKTISNSLIIFSRCMINWMLMIKLRFLIETIYNLHSNL